MFDPERYAPKIDDAPNSDNGPVELQVWRAVGPRQNDGSFQKLRRVHAGKAPAFSNELGAWLVVTEGGRRLRLADDRAGTRRWPTAAERADQQEARTEAAEAELDESIRR